MKKNLLIAILTTATLFVNAQEHGEHSKQSGEAEHTQMAEHEDDKFIGIEIINTGFLAYSFAEKAVIPGHETHITYWVNHKWGFGGSYTRKYFDEATPKNEFAIIGSYNPTSWMTVNAGPSFSLPRENELNHEGHPEELVVLGYVEIEFNARLKKWVHIGPVIGSTFGKENEIYGGFHIGFEF